MRKRLTLRLSAQSGKSWRHLMPKSTLKRTQRGLRRRKLQLLLEQHASKLAKLSKVTHTKALKRRSQRRKRLYLLLPSKVKRVKRHQTAWRPRLQNIKRIFNSTSWTTPSRMMISQSSKSKARSTNFSRSTTMASLVSGSTKSC